MKFIFVLLLGPLLIVPAYGETQTLPTDKQTLNVRLTYEPIEPNTQTRIKVDFINPQTEKIQEHIDYTVSVSKNGTDIFGPIPMTHTTPGTVRIPIEFLDQGLYTMNIWIAGILFQPIPEEMVSFDIMVQNAAATEPQPEPDIQSEGGGCLIATATFGSELSPQVQQLRELRDNTILETNSGVAFMSGFNQMYYSFSPAISDMIRENAILKETIKIGLVPMITSLSMLNHIQINSEQDIIVYGVSLILLNIGMYVGLPVFGFLKLYQLKRSKLVQN